MVAEQAVIIAEVEIRVVFGYPDIEFPSCIKGIEVAVVTTLAAPLVFFPCHFLALPVAVEGVVAIAAFPPGVVTQGGATGFTNAVALNSVQ